MTTKKIMGLTALLLLAGCEATSRPSNGAADNLTYFRDPDTGLCFAAVASQTADGFKVVSIANVPCDAIEGDDAGASQ